MTESIKRVWQPLGVGCARQISVGPNGVPWITGCNGGNPNATGPAWVYYLTWEEGSLIPTPKWVYDNFSAVNIYVNLQGEIYASDSTGAIYWDIQNLAHPGEAINLPSGLWEKVADPAANSFAVTVGKELSPDDPNAGELFYPSQSVPPYSLRPADINGQINLWCTGCDGRDPITGPFSDRDASLWVAQTSFIAGVGVPTVGSWAGLPGAAVQISMVTNSPGTTGSAADVQQTPWVVNKEGGVYYFSAYDGQNATFGHDGQWVQINCPEPALYVTDGFLLTTGGVYFLDATGTTDPSQWLPYIGFPSDDNGDPVKLKQIAGGGWISSGVVGGNPMGFISDGESYGVPPQDQPPGVLSTPLWGLDYEGNVYYVQFEEVIPTQ